MSRMISLDQLGGEVRKKRGDRRLEDVVSDIGVSAATLSRVERGQIPDLATVQKLAEWLDVNVKAAGTDDTGIETEADLERAVAVYLRAKKNLPEKTARSIAKSVRFIMDYEVNKAMKHSDDQ